MALSPAPLIESQLNDYHLGIDVMDKTHQEFIDLVNCAANAKGAEFKAVFEKLVNHTDAHFEQENRLMREYAFPAIEEHRGEHYRVLSEMRQLETRIAKGSTLLAKTWLQQQLPSWFMLHARTMDAALASHLKSISSIESIK